MRDPPIFAGPKDEYLFIGGPIDGQRRHIVGDRTSVMLPVMLRGERLYVWRYDRHEMAYKRNDARVVYFYAYFASDHEQTDADVERVIENYNIDLGDI